jgi:hypothetical protein
MSPKIDLLGRCSVRYRESAARLEAVATRKRRNKEAEIQRIRIIIRGVRIVKGATVAGSRWLVLFALFSLVVLGK